MPGQDEKILSSVGGGRPSVDTRGGADHALQRPGVTELDEERAIGLSEADAGLAYVIIGVAHENNVRGLRL